MTKAAESAERIAALAHELEAAHGAFALVLGSLTRDQLAASRLVGEWGVREIIAHLGYWAGNAAEAIHQAELGTAAQFGADEPDVEARNAVVARVARDTELATVRAREEAAFKALLDRVRRADPAWLDETTATSETIGFLVRDDGADHYRDHAADLRAAIGGSDAS
ncbi:MAG: maleylpyruvate isomerase N-terminal domain-containing protein [Chloroflexota bacterium]|nr:maleylpyruvate isomerase N-terminal domain-containing protein [Chloroflexota bacterium]